ncbi:MAG: hypothetical protein ACE5Z5_09440 [Candidatus Bathyarchaeia archaeon]
MGLIFLSIVAFFIGRRRNRKTTQAIYEAVWDVLEERCPSDLARFKGSWTGVVTGAFELRRGEVFETMEVIVSMIQRELGFHYLLSRRIKKIDRLTVWATMRRRPRFEMVAVSWNHHNLGSLIERLKAVDLGDGGSGELRLYASDVESARRFFRERVAPRVAEMGSALKELAVDKEKASVHLLLEARPEHVIPSLKLAFDLGAFASRRGRRG